MKLIKQFSILIFLFIGVQEISAQKPFYDTKDEVVDAAKQVLDEEIKTGKLKDYVESHQIKGNYTFDITIRHKGEVVTVMAIDHDGTVNHQNLLKDYIKEMKFPFKMPKTKSFKFNYAFKF